jgi:hypothetical protein
VYRPPSATDEIAGWIDAALERAEHWQVLETIDPTSGEIVRDAEIDVWERRQTGSDSALPEALEWTERVLLVRSAAYQAASRRRREVALARLTDDLTTLWLPPTRGRKCYRQREELEQVVAARIAKAGLSGLVHAPVREEPRSDGTSRWTVAQIWVDTTAWQAMIERLGWQVYVTNTTAAQYPLAAVVQAYRQQPIEERSFSRLKRRNLHIRPVYLRDEQRIAGLLWLLCLALRVLTLTEYRVRTALLERQETLVGLNPASRRQATLRPTTERVIAAFANITRTTITLPEGCHAHVTRLNTTQRHILILLKLPADLYERLVAPLPNLEYHLRE